MTDQITPVIGIIGGSGVYDIEGLQDKAWRHASTPWGDPSDQLLEGTLAGTRCVFLPRHGRGHPTSPSHLNYRANIDAMKRAGVTDIISLSAVGSLREELPPDALETAANSLGLPVTRGGTYLVMEGPQFSTKAESNLYRSWDCAVIGMTNMPEAKLAREAEICYATVAMVTDYDCWHPDHDAVTVDQIVRVLLSNAEHGRSLVAATIPHIAAPRGPCPAGCDRALDHAIITAPDKRNPALMAKLDAVAGRVLG
jgi:5'-methylthioadenosine phosphorylase